MTDDELDHWRTVADEPADRAVAGYFESAGTPRARRRWCAELVEHLDCRRRTGCRRSPSSSPRPRQLPSWADPARMAAGRRSSAGSALHQFTALYLASLPSAYAAAKGVHVLWLTARLQTDAERRLNETAQFLMDVTAPGGFDPGGAAIDRILHVRLMHAAVRWLIDHDPRRRPPGRCRSRRAADRHRRGPLRGVVRSTRRTWRARCSRSRPSSSTAFRRSGVESSTTAPRTTSTCGAVIGHVLGVADGLLPTDLAAGRALQGPIFRRSRRRRSVGRRPDGDAPRARSRAGCRGRSPRWRRRSCAATSATTWPT